MAGAEANISSLLLLPTNMTKAIYVLLTPEVLRQLMTSATLKLPPMGPSRLWEVEGTLFLTSHSNPRSQVMNVNTMLFKLSIDQVMDAVNTGAPRLTMPQVASVLAICPWVRNLPCESLGGGAASTNPTADSLVSLTHAQAADFTPIQRFEADIQALMGPANRLTAPLPVAPQLSEAMATPQRSEERVEEETDDAGSFVVQPKKESMHQTPISSVTLGTSSASQPLVTLSCTRASRDISDQVPTSNKRHFPDCNEGLGSRKTASIHPKRSKSNKQKREYKAGDILRPYPDRPAGMRDMEHIFGSCMRRVRGGDPDKPVYYCDQCCFIVALRHNPITDLWEFRFDNTDISTNKHDHPVRYELPLPETTTEHDDHKMNRFLRHHFVGDSQSGRTRSKDHSHGLSEEIAEAVDHYCRLNLNCTTHEVMGHLNACHPMLVDSENAMELFDKVKNRIKNQKQSTAPRKQFLQPLWTHNALSAYHTKYKLPRDAGINKVTMRLSGSPQDIADNLQKEETGAGDRFRWYTIKPRGQELKNIAHRSAVHLKYTPAQNLDYLRTIVALTSPIHMFNLLRWTQNFPPGAISLQCDGMHNIRNEAVLIVLGVNDIRTHQKENKFTHRNCPVLIMLAPSERASTLDYGLTCLRLLSQRLFGYNLVVDWFVSDYSDAFIRGVRQFDIGTIIGLCNPHMSRAPESTLWQKKLQYKAVATSLVKAGIHYLHHCRSPPMFTLIFGKVMFEWESEGLTRFCDFFRKQYGEDSNCKGHYYYGWSSNVIGPLPNNNPLESYFNVIQGTSHVNALGILTPETTVDTLLSKYMQAQVRFDHKWNDDICYGEYDDEDTAFGALPGNILCKTLLMHKNVDVWKIEDDIYLVNANAYIGVKIDECLAEKYLKVVNGEWTLREEDTAKSLVDLVDSICHVHVDRHLTIDDVTQSDDGMTCFLNSQERRGDAITMDRIGTSDGIIKVERRQLLAFLQQNQLFIAPKGISCVCTCKCFRQNFICTGSAFVLDMLGRYEEIKGSLIAQATRKFMDIKKKKKASPGFKLFQSMFPGKDMQEDNNAVVIFQYLHGFNDLSSIIDDMGRTIDRTDKKSLMEACIVNTSYYTEVLGYEWTEVMASGSKRQPPSPGTDLDVDAPGLSSRSRDIDKPKTTGVKLRHPLSGRQVVKNVLPQMSGQYVHEELSTWQGNKNSRAEQGCQYYSFYFAVTHACDIKVEWRKPKRGKASSLTARLSSAVDIDTRPLFASAETRGYPLESQPIVDEALEMVTEFLDLEERLDDICQYAIRTDRMDPALERLNKVLGRKLEKHARHQFSMVFLFRSHMVSVLRFLDKKHKSFFLVIDTLGMDGCKHGRTVKCDSKDGVINAIMHRHRELTIEPVKHGKYGNKTDVNDPFAFVCVFFRRKVIGDVENENDGEDGTSLSDFSVVTESDVQSDMSSTEAALKPNPIIKLERRQHPSDVSAESDESINEPAEPPNRIVKVKQMVGLSDGSDDSSVESINEIAHKAKCDFTAQPKQLPSDSSESSDDSMREMLKVLKMKDKSFIRSSPEKAETAGEDESFVTCENDPVSIVNDEKVIDLYEDVASAVTEADCSTQNSQASTAHQEEMDSDDNTTLDSEYSVDLGCMPWKGLTKDDHQTAKQINDAQHANVKIKLNKVGRKVYSLRHKKFWNIPRMKEIVQPPQTVVRSHGVVNIDVSSCSIERFYNRRSNRKRRKKGRLSNTEDEKGEDPMWLNDEGLGAMEQVYHMYHWDRPEFKRKRVWFMAPLAFNQLLPLSSTKTKPLKSHDRSELESAMRKSLKQPSQPHGYEYDERLLRRPGGGVRYQSETRINIFEEVINVFMPVNVPGFHWFAVNYNVKTRTIQVFDWLGGRYAYHDYAALIMQNWLVDERLYWINKERRLKKQDDCSRDEIWRQMVDDKDHPYCLQNTEFNCRRDQMDGDTCGVRVSLLMLYILLGVDETRYGYVMRNERELQKSRRWLLLCIVKQRLLIPGNMGS